VDDYDIIRYGLAAKYDFDERLPSVPVGCVRENLVRFLLRAGKSACSFWTEGSSETPSEVTLSADLAPMVLESVSRKRLVVDLVS
jgi:hypothetical protein